LSLLGLAPVVWATLAEQIDRVVHCAAVVDRCATFDSLRGANVSATARVQALAKYAGADMHFISSSAALPPVGTVAGMYMSV
jgi:thioester reductase-like protein